QLQQQLAADDRAAMRRYHRYLCALPAQLVQRRDDATVDTLDVELADISAGGAKLVCGNGSLGPGDVVWLTVDLAQANCSRLAEPDADLVVLASRVVWARPLDAEVGIIFAGAPRFERDLAQGL
ncbi:MAG: PilZ domain-containing protein, partial [Nannocystaceae bacterium]